MSNHQPVQQFLKGFEPPPTIKIPIQQKLPNFDNIMNQAQHQQPKINPPSQPNNKIPSNMVKGAVIADVANKSIGDFASCMKDLRQEYDGRSNQISRVVDFAPYCVVKTFIDKTNIPGGTVIKDALKYGLDGTVNAIGSEPTVFDPILKPIDSGLTKFENKFAGETVTSVIGGEIKGNMFGYPNKPFDLDTPKIPDIKDIKIPGINIPSTTPNYTPIKFDPQIHHTPIPNNNTPQFTPFPSSYKN